MELPSLVQDVPLFEIQVMGHIILVELVYH
jgi:hypothetical protein